MRPAGRAIGFFVTAVGGVGRYVLGRARRRCVASGFAASDEQCRRRLLLGLALALEERGAELADVRIDLGSGDGKRPGRLITGGKSVAVAGAEGVFVFVSGSGRNLARADEDGIRVVADALVGRASDAHATARTRTGRRSVWAMRCTGK